MANDPIPNPGSSKALDLGCTCPVVDNRSGYGVRSRNRSETFVITAGCPIHEWKEKEDVDGE